MKNLLLLSSLTCFLILSGCYTSHVTYVGDSYQYSNQVELFFDENKVNGDYEIMGHAVSQGGKPEHLELELIERAKKEGADAVIISSLDKESDGESFRNLIKAVFVKYL